MARRGEVGGRTLPKFSIQNSEVWGVEVMESDGLEVRKGKIKEWR